MSLARLLYELSLPGQAAAAAQGLAAHPCAEARAALAALIAAPPSAAAAISAIDTYLGYGDAPPHRWLEAACQSPFTSVRERAAAALRDRASVPTLVALLGADPAWIVRQAALQSLASVAHEADDDELRWHCLKAIDDPHWRVRNDLLEHLVPWCQASPALHQAIESRFADASAPRSQGVLRYLAFSLALLAGDDVSDVAPSPR